MLASATQAKALSQAQPANPVESVDELKRTIAAQRHLTQFSKYLSVTEIPLYGGPVEVLGRGADHWPRRIDIDPKSQLRVEAALPTESIDALVDAGIKEVCVRISGDTQEESDLSVTVTRRASLTLPSAFAASKALVFKVESRACSAPSLSTLADTSVALRDRVRVQALAAALAVPSHYTFHEAGQRSNVSKSREILVEDGFSLLIDKKSAVQIRGKGDDTIAQQMRIAGVWSLCIEASWPDASDGSKTKTKTIEVRANDHGPATFTPAFVLVESRSAAYSLTVKTREGGCKAPSTATDALNERIYQVDVDDLGLQLLPPVISDAVIFGWTSLPDTVRPTTVTRAEHISKLGVNVFLWGDRFRTRDRSWLTRTLRRAIGFNITPGITVAGPKVADGGKQTAVSLGIVIAEPTNRAIFLGFGRLSFGPQVKNPGMVFLGVSGVGLVELGKKILP
jgi:hypothetical protein